MGVGIYHEQGILEMMNTKRIVYLDVAKGIGMLLVVLGHVEYVSMEIRQFISAFHMPLFFLISGILIQEKHEEEKSFAKLARRKARNIMIPYVIFSLLSFCIEGARITLKGLDEWNIIFRQLYQSCCLQGVSTLWFLPALFISELVFIGMRKKLSNKATVALSAVLVVLCGWLNSIEQTIYQVHAASLKWGLMHDILSMLIRNLLCVGFVAVGYYWSKYCSVKLKKTYVELIVTSIAAIFTFLSVWLNPEVDLRFMQLHFVPLYLLGAISGSVAMIMLCRILVKLPCEPVRRMLAFYGCNSLIIMVTHMDFRVLNCSIKVAALVTGGTSQLLFCVLIVLLVFVFEIPIIWFINRFLPFILGKKI